MNCKVKNREKVINDYFLGALSKADKDAFDEHCFNCEICFQELKLKEDAIRLIKQDGQEIFAYYLDKKDSSKREKVHSTIFDFPWIPIGKAPAYVLATIFIMLLSIGIYQKFASKYPFNFDENVPCQYTQSGLRGGSDNYQKFSPYNNFVNQFLIGISYYVSNDYVNAIDSWKKMDSTAQNFARQTSNEKFQLASRDYYFFRGVSHLALSVSENDKLELSEQKRKSHLNEAINFLLKANELISLNKFDNEDREIYHLGIAFGLSGQKEFALEQLNKLKPESQYFENGKKYIKQWGE